MLTISDILFTRRSRSLYPIKIMKLDYGKTQPTSYHHFKVTLLRVLTLRTSTLTTPATALQHCSTGGKRTPIRILLLSGMFSLGRCRTIGQSTTSSNG